MIRHVPAGTAAARWRGVIAGLLFVLLTAGAWGALCRALSSSFGIWAAWLPFTALVLAWGLLIRSRRRRTHGS